MIPRVITDTSIMFIARGQPWTLAADHGNFETVKALLLEGIDDEDRLIHLTDVTMAVADVTEGRVTLTEDGVTLDGQQLSQDWMKLAVEKPDAMKVLVVRKGDRVRVHGDRDAPDGIYIVGEVDNDDAEKRIYVEDEAGEDFFGYVDNTSIKEILNDQGD